VVPPTSTWAISAAMLAQTKLLILRRSAPRAHILAEIDWTSAGNRTKDALFRRDLRSLFPNVDFLKVHVE
jgi:hypothetical protein